MKNLMILVLISIFTLGSNTIMAQKTKNTKTISIKTSAQCKMCKNSIEKALAYEKGISSSTLNIATTILIVNYKPTKTTPEKIRKAISEIGYDADTIKANKKAYNNLPVCCQKGGMNH
jgi:mercuric ion binding protein